MTYPIVSALLGAPGVKAVRGMSDFGHSLTYVIFEDGTDLYWARARVQEYLSTVLTELPADARTQIGPDATGLGWVFQYALVDESGRSSLADLRDVQDSYLRYHLQAVPGVAEVATFGGFEKEYQIDVDPNRLLAFGVSIEAIVEAVRGGNVETGARLIEIGGTEYMVRGRGYARSVGDLGEVVVATEPDGRAIRVRDVARVGVGPGLRRGIADLDGRGDVVSGIVVMRQGQNALDVIDAVKDKLAKLEPGLPEGVRVVAVYDRSDLVNRAILTLNRAIVEIILTTSIVILLLLRHGPSAAVPIVTIPVAVIISMARRLPGWRRGSMLREIPGSKQPGSEGQSGSCRRRRRPKADPRRGLLLLNATMPLDYAFGYAPWLRSYDFSELLSAGAWTGSVETAGGRSRALDYTTVAFFFNATYHEFRPSIQESTRRGPEHQEHRGGETGPRDRRPDRRE